MATQPPAALPRAATVRWIAKFPQTSRHGAPLHFATGDQTRRAGGRRTSSFLIQTSTIAPHNPSLQRRMSTPRCAGSARAGFTSERGQRDVQRGRAGRVALLRPARLFVILLSRCSDVGRCAPRPRLRTYGSRHSGNEQTAVAIDHEVGRALKAVGSFDAQACTEVLSFAEANERPGDPQRIRRDGPATPSQNQQHDEGLSRGNASPDSERRRPRAERPSRTRQGKSLVGPRRYR